jgi:hypothetical protein
MEEAGGPPWGWPCWACAENVDTVMASSETNGRTTLDRLDAFIRKNPFLAVRRAPMAVPSHRDAKNPFSRRMMTRPTLLTGSSRFVLLQIRKITTILRRS